MKSWPFPFCDRIQVLVNAFMLQLNRFHISSWCYMRSSARFGFGELSGILPKAPQTK